MTEHNIIALDIGGSSVRGGIIDATDLSVREFRAEDLDSYADAESIISKLAAVIDLYRREAGDQGLIGIALGFPGPFDYAQGISLMKGGAATDPGVSHTGGRSKFESLYRVNVREALGKKLSALDVPILFRNDAEAAIIGEAKFGSGQAFRRVIGVTLGTGLGSAFIADGQVVLNNQAVPPNGWLYCMPFNGVQADQTFSTRGLVRRLREAGVTTNDVQAAGDAARAGDVRSRTAFLDFGHALGKFLTPYVSSFHAQAVLVLGGIANTFDLFQPAIASSVAIPVMAGTPELHAALLGAAELFMRNI
ncbi:MAG TPA: ROK family protein [Anaerolineae bacterium]